MRFAFNYGIWWIQEIVQLAILSAYFLGTSYIFKARQYLVIDLVFDRLGDRSRIAVYLAIQLLTAAFCLMLVIELLGLAPGQLRMKTFVLHVPRFYASIPLPVASASMLVTALYYGLAVTSRALRGRAGREAHRGGRVLVSRIDRRRDLVITATMLLVFLGLMALRAPVSISIGVSSALGVFLAGVPLEIVPRKMTEGVDSFTLLAVPFSYWRATS